MDRNLLAKELGQRTERGLSFDRKLRTLGDKLRSEPDLVRAVDERLRQLQLSPTGVTTTPVLQELSVAYANDDFIGERLMPTVPHSKLSGEYWSRTKATGFSYPDDAVGTEGSVNQVSEKVETDTFSLTRRSLKEKVDAWTMDEMDSVVAELVDPMMNVMDGLAFRRELRIAAVAGVSATYGSNTTAIAAASRWDTASGGNPGKVVDTAKTSLWSGTGPGRWVAFCSLDVYNALKRNPVILDAVKYSGSITPAMVNRRVLASYFEVDELLVGMARKNSANENQTASYARMWPDVFGIVRVADRPSRRSASFGITIEQPLQTQQWFQNSVGGRGAYWTQASLADKHQVLCADCGYLITTPIG